MTTNPAAGIIPSFDLHDRLRKARENAGLEQVELAERIGVSRNTIGNAERGTHAVRKIVINAWAMATGVDRGWLETGQAPVEGPGPDGARPAGFEPATCGLNSGTVLHFRRPTEQQSVAA